MFCTSYPLNYNTFSYFTKEGYWRWETAKNIPYQLSTDKTLKTITLFFYISTGYFIIQVNRILASQYLHTCSDLLFHLFCLSFATVIKWDWTITIFLLLFNYCWNKWSLRSPQLASKALTYSTGQEIIKYYLMTERKVSYSIKDFRAFNDSSQSNSIYFVRKDYLLKLSFETLMGWKTPTFVINMHTVKSMRGTLDSRKNLFNKKAKAMKILWIYFPLSKKEVSNQLRKLMDSSQS